MAIAELLLFPIAALIVGLIALTYSANYFTDGAISLARNLNISTLTIGIFVLGFGTSAPEIVVSALSTLEGYPGLAVGNVIGSNIANVGLVLGVAALLYPITVNPSTLKFETTLMIVVSIIVVGIMVWDQMLGGIDGWILILLFLSTVGIFYYKKTKQPTIEQEEDDEIPNEAHFSLKKSIIVTLIALIFLLISARAIVWGATELASFFNISDTLVGLTIIAIGTSLPELAAAISASLKKQSDLTLGNILGSNLFNLLAVLPFPAFIIGFQLPNRFLSFDLLIMLGLSILIPIVVLLNKKRQIGRIAGIIMLLTYCFYLAILIKLTL
jgi:cation:H+ antiporter